MEGKVAVLGSADFVMPFSAMGLDTYPVGDNREEIIAGANAIIEGRYALVFTDTEHRSGSVYDRVHRFCDAGTWRIA
jgi:vacuolar-type H+-ATPase subunit F/Vma7